MQSRISTKRLEVMNSEVDLTPMLDVVFIMLIFFIVMATYIRETGIEVERPSKSNSESSEVLVIRLTESGEIWLHGRRIDILSVRANIERLLVETPGSAVSVKAAQRTKTAVFSRVIDYAYAAGAQRVSLITDGG